MDEEIEIINNNTRTEKIKNFLINFKKQIIIFLVAIIIIIFGYFIYNDLKKKNKIKIADSYNQAIINYHSGDLKNTKAKLLEIIAKKDKTYSPLSLYFLLDNDIITEKVQINRLFDILINESNLEKEIKNLIIYKKALFNSEFETENNLIKILNPLINSESVWESHALYLMAEYFFSKNEKQKSKEFFEKIMLLKNANLSIKTESQKRLNRDFGE